MQRIVCFIFLIACLIGCQDANKGKVKTSNKKQFYIVTTTGHITDMVKNIGATHVKVDGLMGPGVDPHLYKITEKDARKLSKADMIIYNGLHLEGKMGNILTKMGRSKDVYAITEDLSKNKLREPPEFAGLYDPHIWFDVSLWQDAVPTVVAALCKLDPPHAKNYKENGEKYKQKLEKLHKWTLEKIAEVPKEDRILITAHDAFGYFGRAYGVKVEGLQGISTASEFGVKDVERIIDVLVKKKIKAIFVESSVSRKPIEAVVHGCNKQGHKVIIGGSLFSDAMGQEGTPEGTYIGMVKHNVNTIVNALKGKTAKK